MSHTPATRGLPRADALAPRRRALGGALLALAAPAVAFADGPAVTDGADSRLHPIPVRATMQPIDPVIVAGDGASDPLAGACPQEISTLSPGVNFDAGTITLALQAGMGEGEMAAHTYQLSATDFPIILDQADVVFGTSNAVVTTTTQWSFLVWEGTPTSGNLVAQYSSDGVILPHVVLPPGTNGVVLSVVGDTQEPIVIQNNGSARFTIAFRIDEHNNQTQNPCLFGPSPSQNAFMGTDTDGLQNSGSNWLFGLNCGPFGCPANGGWATFTQLPGLCTPSGDWVMRALWRQANCGSTFGACCLPDGACEVQGESDCLANGGTYQGSGISCLDVSCPQPSGACCVDGLCSDGIGEEDCTLGGGAWLGPDSVCSAGICGQGACCIEATGGCLDLDADTCATVGGVFSGTGTACDSIICFPIGACCLPDGSCLDDQSPDDCTGAGGVFQGDGTTCGGVSCPAPTGACCLTNGNCVLFSEADCAIVGGTWAGMMTDCEDNDGSGTADACEKSAPCDGDVDDSGAVDFSDLLAVLSSWGLCVDCPADLDDNDEVNFSDLLIVLSAWGDCP